jgi:hypothetical protein
MNIIMRLSCEGIRCNSITNASCLLGVVFLTSNEKSPFQFERAGAPLTCGFLCNSVVIRTDLLGVVFVLGA